MLPKVTVFLFIYLRLCTGQNVGQQTITYECTADKHITLVNQDLHKVKVLKTDGTCILTNSSLQECGFTPGTPINIILQEGSVRNIVGGVHSRTFQLTCVDEGVYTVTNAPTQLDIINPTVGETLTHGVPHAITLTLKDKSDADVVNAVYIGQELKMILKITDPDYTLSPQKCTAIGSGSDDIVIWTATGSSCTHETSIIEERWVGADQSTLSIKMYGFYFLSSKHVTIECTTKVCKAQSKGGMLTCPKDCMTVPSRRRRDAIKSSNETFSYVKSVQVAFDVAVNEAGVNSAVGTLPTKPVYGLLGIILFTMMQRS